MTNCYLGFSSLTPWLVVWEIKEKKKNVSEKRKEKKRKAKRFFHLGWELRKEKKKHFSLLIGSKEGNVITFFTIIPLNITQITIL